MYSFGVDTQVHKSCRKLTTKALHLSPKVSCTELNPYNTLPSLYLCVWLVNTLTSTAPIVSPIIICTWAPADIWEQWEGNLTTRFSRRLWGSPLEDAERGRAVGPEGKKGVGMGRRGKGPFPFSPLSRFSPSPLPTPPYVCTQAICGAGTRDEPLRTSAWEARLQVITKGTRFGLSSVEVCAFYLSPENKNNLETAGSAHWNCECNLHLISYR